MSKIQTIFYLHPSPCLPLHVLGRSEGESEISISHPISCLDPAEISSVEISPWWGVGVGGSGSDHFVEQDEADAGDK